MLLLELLVLVAAAGHQGPLWERHVVRDEPQVEVGAWDPTMLGNRRKGAAYWLQGARGSLAGSAHCGEKLYVA